MEKDLKDLLLQDLSARLPYGVKCAYLNTKNELKVGELLTVWCKEKRVFIDKLSIDYDGCDCIGVIPYLFPLSSITGEQALELYKLFGIKLTNSIGWDYIKINEVTGITFFLRKGFDVETHLDKLIDWLLKNHFDFRGLIPMGLAKDATGLNIY